MERSRIALADAVDALVDAGRATVTETAGRLSIYQLDAAGARRVVPLLAPADLALTLLADEGGDVDPDAIGDEAEGIQLEADKPAAPAGVLPVVTGAGFRRLLERIPERSVVWLTGLAGPVETLTVAYRPWGDPGGFAPMEEPPGPARVVRRLDGVVPGPLGPWLLRDPDADVADRRLAPWRRRSAEELARAIAQEVEPDGSLLFRGPPTARFAPTGAANVDVGSLAALQRAAAWAYESPRELEARHGLLATEVARVALRGGGLADLASLCRLALEGARIAYGFGLTQQSRDALKSLSDLRKAVSDETARLSEATRTLGTAVTTAAVGNVGLVVARLTIARDSAFAASAAAAVALALALHVAVAIAGGLHYLAVQRDLATGWRERLYGYLTADEYAAMVTGPVGRAEGGFRTAAWCSGLVTGLMLLAVLLVGRTTA